jgi:Recombinase/Resolvase, N terminal domain/Recombinase zinc beta ribbon domain
VKTAYSYRRWSTKSQGNDGRDSRNRQKTSAESWIEQHGNGEYVLSKDVFEDAGKSGFKGKHIAVDDFGKAKGELMRFIQLVEAGKIKKGSLLLIDSWDRFSRLPAMKTLALFNDVLSCGIGLVVTGSHDKRVVTEDLLNKEPYLLMGIIMEVIRSHSESAEKSRKVILAKAAKKEKMQAGEILAHNNIPKYFTFNRDKKCYEHNDNTIVVRQLIERFLSGTTLYELACDLNKRNVKTFRNGENWHPCSVRQILKNRVLIGEYLGCKDYVPAIIDENQFNKIQNTLGQNRLNRGKKADLSNLFKGICECEHCNHKMNVMAQNKDGLSYRYLRCSNYHSGNTICRHNYIRLEPMEQDFILMYLAKNPMALVNPEDKEELKKLRTDATTKTADAHRITAAINMLLDMIDTMKAPELRERLTKLTKKRDTLNAELDDINVKINALQDAPSITIEAFEDTLPKDWQARIQEFNSNQYLEDKAHEITPVAAFSEKLPADWAKRISDTNMREKITLPRSKAYINWFLHNNEWREKLRVLMPSLIGKITVLEHKFKVFNRVGKLVFESPAYESQRNKTERWKNALKTWTTRKINGKIETVKRKVK